MNIFTLNCKKAVVNDKVSARLLYLSVFMRTADLQLQQRRRDEILASAERCFVEKGFHQASVAEIAAGANLSMGLMYRVDA